MHDAVPDHDVLGIEQEAFADGLGKLLPELVQGGMFPVGRRLDLDRTDVAPLAQKKIYFHRVRAVILAATGVEKQLVSLGTQHLRHDVFHQHAFVDAKLVEKVTVQ